MKKILSTILACAFLAMAICPVYALNASPPKNITVKCDINSTKIFINKKLIGIGTIKYNGEVYVPVNDIAGYFNARIQSDGNAGTINITPSKTKIALKPDIGKRITKKGSTVSIGIDTYMIELEGFYEYVDNIAYQNVIYVNIKYFAEMFDKTVEVKKDGSMEIHDTPLAVAGTVNGESITRKEFDYLYNPALKSLEARNGKLKDTEKDSLKQQAFEKLVEMKIVLQKARSEKMQLTAQDIPVINSQMIANFVDSYQGIANLRKDLYASSVCFHQLVLYARDYYLCTKLLGKYIGTVEISEEEIKQYYDQNKDQFVNAEKVRAKHILILTSDNSGKQFSPEMKAKAKKKAEEILGRLQKGEDFDKLMKAYSEDTGLKQNPDGYTFGRGEMVKEFEDTAFSLEPGKLSGIVETTYGYHIIKVEEKFPGGQKSYDEARSEIKTALDQAKETEYTNKLITEWKKNSKIVEKI